MSLLKKEQVNYIETTDDELTVDSLLSEIEHIVKQEVTVNNTWQLLYNILKRENRI